MSSIIVYNQSGEETGKALLPKEIFDVGMNADLLHQVIKAQMANKRQGTAHTKTRGEVRGGGKKPWRQKGTGRARHGSIRSPIWKGGGVVFGPRNEKNYEQKINKKMRRLAFFMALSGKARDEEIIVLDDLKMDKPKTKEAAHIVKSLTLKQDKSAQELKVNGKILLVLPGENVNVFKAFRNLPNVEIIEARNLNTLAVLSSKYLVMPKSSIAVIKKTFLTP